MASGGARPIARELLRKTAAQPASETAVGSVGHPPDASGWRRYLHGFTVLATGLTGLACVTVAFPEKDARGRDHVFSAPRRAFDRLVDELLGPRRTPRAGSAPEPASPAAAPAPAASTRESP